MRLFAAVGVALIWLLLCKSAFAGSAQAVAELEVVSQLGHSGDVMTVAISPDGAYLASGAADRSVRLWDLATGRLLRTSSGHTDWVNSVKFTPDGKFLVSASSDSSIKLWNLATGELVRTFTRHDGMVYSIAVSPDSRYIVSGSSDFTVKIWEIATGNLVRGIRHKAAVEAVALTVDGRQIISATSDSLIQVWDFATRELVRAIKEPDDNSFGISLAVTPDGRHLISAIEQSEEHIIKAWDLTTGELAREWSFPEGQFIDSLAVSPDGKYVISTSSLGVCLWDITTGMLFYGYRYDGSVDSAAVSPDGKYIVAGGADDKIRLWDRTTHKVLRYFEGFQSFVDSVAVTSNGKHIVAGGSDNTLKLWDLQAGSLQRSLVGHTNRIVHVATTPNGKYAVAADYDDNIKLWDLAAGRPVRSFTGHKEAAREVAVTPDGRFVAAASWDKTVKLWDIETGKLLRSFAHDSNVLALAVTLDSRYIITGSKNSSVQVWDLATGQLLRRIDGDSVGTLAVSPDGHSVLFASGHTITLVNFTTGVVLRTFSDTESYFHTVAISPDGKQIVSGDDKSIKLWDVQTGRLVHTLIGHRGTVNSVAVTPDGRQVISGSGDGTVRIWDMESGRELASLIGGRNGGSLAVTPHGFFTIDGDEQGASFVNVSDGTKAYDIRQFYQALYRPELVEELLKGDPEGKYEAAASELDLRQILNSGPAPRLELKRTERVGDDIRMTVEITSEGGGISKVEWRVNGILQDGQRSATAVDDDEKVRIDTRSFPLIAGANEITVTAYNKAGLISAKPVIEKVDRLGVADSEKARLYILAVGINDYAEESLQLSYAVNDSEIFSARLRDAAGNLGLFSVVSVVTLINAEVTRHGLDRAFTDLAKVMRPEDKFVFFAAGHGKVYKDRYYFFPQDIRFGGGDAIVSQGIDQETWQSWFSRIPARASVLIYDTCEAGRLTTAIRGGSGIRTAVDLLQHATGRSILAATTAQDAAREGFENHGVFTYALLQALSQGDMNDDGRIEVVELGQYVERTVPELSGRRWGIEQRPRFSIQANFPLASRVVQDGPGVAFIPKTPTHVVIKPITVAATERGETSDATELKPGTAVRVMQEQGGSVLIARDGRAMGYVPTDALAPLQW